MSITTLFFSCAPTHRVVYMHTMPDLNPVEQHVLVHLTCPDSPQRCPGPDLRGDPVPCLIRSVPHVVRRPYRHIRSILLHQFITLVFGVSLNLAYCSFFPHLLLTHYPLSSIRTRTSMVGPEVLSWNPPPGLFCMRVLPMFAWRLSE